MCTSRTSRTAFYNLHVMASGSVNPRGYFNFRVSRMPSSLGSRAVIMCGQDGFLRSLCESRGKWQRVNVDHGSVTLTYMRFLVESRKDARIASKAVLCAGRAVRCGGVASVLCARGLCPVITLNGIFVIN